MRGEIEGVCMTLVDDTFTLAAGTHKSYWDKIIGSAVIAGVAARFNHKAIAIPALGAAAYFGAKQYRSRKNNN